MNLSEILLLSSAAASALAAIAAAVATWRAPRAAAEFAERLRRDSERMDQINRQKLYIFSEVMKARGVQITRESVAAFNLIDLAFISSTDVRDRWAELYSAYTKGDRLHSTIEDKMNALLKAMAEDIGLSENLRPADFERYYYPNVLADEDYARSVQLRSFLEGLQSNSSHSAEAD